MSLAVPDDQDQGQDGLDRVSREILRFERLVVERPDLVLREYWRERSPHMGLDVDERMVCLSGLIKADLRRRFERGETVPVASYLDDFPQLRDTDSRVVSLVYEEFCLREERGDSLDVESFCDRYPEWKDSLVSQLGYHRLLSQVAGMAAPKPKFPDVGESFEEFALLEQIGRGGYSRVFLASDRSLGGKRVVLKVSTDRGQEAETQGALDHPHIVPVNSVVYQPDRSLRGLSMPHRPGLPLDEVIRRIRRPGRHPSSARSLWEAVVEGVREGAESSAITDELAASLQAGPTSDGWRGFPIKGTFARGVAWIGLVVARALAYAHDRQTYHRDVKPGNVLLTIQHGPQLLDFNLAQSPHAPSEAHSAIQGGTLPYMAPEQIEAFLNPERWDGVGASADIYSLGLMLRELLTGQALDVPDSKLPAPRALRDLLDRRLCLSADLRRHNRQVPYALEAIVRKCLHHDPDQRYASGKQLADDLEHFLHHRPAVHAANPSRLERSREWITRHRLLVGVNVFYLTVLAVLSQFLIEKASHLLLPPIEQRREFIEAVMAVDFGQDDRAIDILTKLIKEYPRSSLARIYSSIACSRILTLPKDESQFHYEQAMKLPDAEAELGRWAKHHPSLIKHLVQLGSINLENASVSMSQLAQPDQDPAFVRIIAIADHALSNAWELDRTSIEALHGLATVAEFRKDYEVAIERLSRLLKETANATDLDDPSILMSWRVQRARAATLLAGQLARSQEPRDATRAFALVDAALDDLKLEGRTTPDFLLPLSHAYRTQALLTRGELHCQRGEVQLCQAAYRDAKPAMDLWFRVIRARGDRVAPDLEDRYRKRLRSLQDCGGLAQASSSSP